MKPSHDMPIELTEAELAQIQGGGLLRDAWRAVKNGAKKLLDTVIDIFTPQSPFPRWPIPGPGPTIQYPHY